MKKQYLFLWFLALHSALSAFDGFYVGASTGIHATDAEQNGNLLGQTFVLSSPSTISILDPKADYLNVNGEASLYAGYGFQWCGFYTGLEGFIRYSHPQFHFASSSSGTNVDPVLAIDPFLSLTDGTKVTIGPWHYGLDWRTGFLLDCATLFYGRLGVEWSTVRFQNQANYGGLLISGFTPVFDFDLNLNQRKKQAHLRAGLGIEKAINSCLSLRLDYLYTHYGHYHVQGDSSATVVFGVVTASFAKNASLDLSNHALTVGLSYHLNGLDPCCSSCGCKDFCGFYTGLSLGGAIVQGQLEGNRTSTRVFNPVTPLILESETSRHIVDKNICGYGAVGYGFHWNCLFLGMEGFIQYAPHLSHEKNGNLILSASDFTLRWDSEVEIKPWQPGVNFRPGFFLNRSLLLFANLGTSYASIRKSTFQIVGNTLGSINVHFNATKRTHRATFRAGGGVEYAVNCCWHLRGDYIYTNFGTLHFNESITQSIGSTEFLLSTAENTKVHLKSHAVTLGIFKYF